MGTGKILKDVVNYIHEATDAMTAAEYVSFLTDLFFELDEERRKLEWDGEEYEDCE